jgi:hypothetical protein
MTITRPELSRRIPVSRIGAAGMEQTIEATAAECRALAGRLQLPAIASLTCHFHLLPPLRGQVAVEAELRAELTRICVVSLEPFETVVAERFTLRFVPEGAEQDDIDPESPDEVPYAGDFIDIGEAAAEQLALALDPYPRMPGIELPEDVGPEDVGPEDVGPEDVGPEDVGPEDVGPEEAGAGPDRAAGQSAKGRSKADRDTADRPHPFAALARLRGGPQSGNA